MEFIELNYMREHAKKNQSKADVTLFLQIVLWNCFCSLPLWVLLIIFVNIKYLSFHKTLGIVGSNDRTARPEVISEESVLKHSQENT